MATKKDDEKIVNNNYDAFSFLHKKPTGVSDSAWEGTQETFSPSDKTNDAKANMDSASNRYQEHTESDMISSSTKNAMNESFKKPSIVTETDEWLLNQLETIKSGRTSYSDQVEAMMDKILNREKFSYDVDNDTLFQQALASAMKSGKTAMQDTIGQASALTGGYGSTYATSVGNQAYNAYIEDAYNNLPQYYQMALNAYQMESEDMYRQYGMLSDADDKEFNRNVAAYDATFQYRNNVYNEAYTQYRDNKSDAFATANLEMQEYSQKANDLYNLYGIASNTYESMYEKDYTSWADKVNNAWKTVEVENNDGWANKNFDESVRQYEQTFAEQQRQYNESLAEQKRQHNEQMAYNYASLNQKKSGGGSGGSELTSAETKRIEEIFAKAGGGQAGLEQVDSYLSSIGKNNLSEESSAGLQSILNGLEVPTYYQNWTISDDTYNGGFLGLPIFQGDDNNDVYSNGSTTMTFKELKEAIENSDLDEDIKKQKIDNLRKQSKR